LAVGSAWWRPASLDCGEAEPPVDSIGVMPPVVHMLCGLTGSGKTTYAKRLEASGAVRLSVDEEVFARHGRYGVDYPMDEYFDRERPVVEELRCRLVELVESGRDVVLDYGLWRRSDRDSYKRLVEAHGGRWRLLYFKVDPEVLVQRLSERNRRDDANALAVTPSALEDFIARFDEPVDEGEELVDSGWRSETTRPTGGWGRPPGDRRVAAGPQGRP
jgi:predicted kinase